MENNEHLLNRNFHFHKTKDKEGIPIIMIMSVENMEGTFKGIDPPLERNAESDKIGIPNPKTGETEWIEYSPAPDLALKVVGYLTDNDMRALMEVIPRDIHLEYM